MPHVAWSVCLCLCLSVCMLVTRVSCAKTAEPIEMPFGRLTHVGSHNLVLDGVHLKGQFWKGHVSTHWNVPITHECIAHCSPAATGECACPAHAADECICCRERQQDGDVAFCQITLDTCFSTCGVDFVRRCQWERCLRFSSLPLTS